MKKFVLQVMWNNFQLGTRRTQMQILNPKPFRLLVKYFFKLLANHKLYL